MSREEGGNYRQTLQGKIGLTKIVDVRNFGYAYPPPTPEQEEVWVLENVSMQVEAGEFLSIMGPTGVGKTTLCLALNGIVPQSTGGAVRGDIMVDGMNTKKHPIAKLAQEVGIVFQEPETQLFNLTVEADVAFGLETLGFPRREIEERITWALSVVGMEDQRHRSPFHLSGGQMQRVAIASMLAMTPKVLVLDEPTASLDPVGKAEVFSVVRGLRRERGMTIVMVEHEPEHIAEFSDRVVVLHNGHVEMDGPPQEILSQSERLRELGLRAPQVSELAECLRRRYGTGFDFVRIDEAHAALSDRFGGGG